MKRNLLFLSVIFIKLIAAIQPPPGSPVLPPPPLGSSADIQTCKKKFECSLIINDLDKAYSETFARGVEKNIFNTLSSSPFDLEAGKPIYLIDKWKKQVNKLSDFVKTNAAQDNALIGAFNQLLSINNALLNNLDSLFKLKESLKAGKDPKTVTILKDKSRKIIQNDQQQIKAIIDRLTPQPSSVVKGLLTSFATNLIGITNSALALT